VNVPPILQRHPGLRWLAPVGVACVVGVVATGLFSSRASSNAALPRTTPAALIAAVQSSRAEGFSGTVVSHLSLGLPDLPSLGTVADGTSFTSMLSGSHTLQVWYGGVDRERVALLGATDETDVFRDGRQLWQWNSADNSALHVLLPQPPAGPTQPKTSPFPLASLTPAGLANGILGSLDSTTRVEVQQNDSVADRSAYQLVLTPRTTATKVGQVRIAIDGQTKVPLGVQIYARGASSPAVDIEFTSVVFGSQPLRNFQFSPPEGATVREKTVPAHPGAAAARSRSRFTTTGTGWSTVATLRPSAQVLDALRGKSALAALTPVRGSWGNGHLLDSPLVSVLLTDDGRVLVGAVAPDALYAAAGRK
jgi:hypothetical protein